MDGVLLIPIIAAALLAACAAEPAAPSASAAATRTFEPAPVPNPDSTGPAAPTKGAVVTPTLVSPYAGERSDGFLPGSVYKNREDTPSTRGPGMRLSLPLGE